SSAKVLQLDPEDPDLTKVDEVWGFYLPQYNANSAATYPRDCPAKLASAPELQQDVVDVTETGWDGKLLTLFLRQLDGGNQADASFNSYLYQKKWAAKELAGYDDSLFAIQMSAALRSRSTALDAALSALQTFGGTPDHLSDPRRDYDIDNEASPPPGLVVGP